jgi:hypothetical protein
MDDYIVYIDDDFFVPANRAFPSYNRKDVFSVRFAIKSWPRTSILVNKTAEHKERKGKKMKAPKLTLVKTIVAVSLLIGLSNAAFARTGVYVSAGFGRPDFNRGYHPSYRFDHHPRYSEPAQQHYYPHRETIILSGGYCYDQGPDYYVITTPTIIRKTPVIIEKQIVFVRLR